MQKKSWNLKVPSTWIDHEPEQNVDTSLENHAAEPDENEESPRGPDILLVDEKGEGEILHNEETTPCTEIVNITGPSVTPRQSDSPKSRVESAQYGGSTRPSSRVTFREPGDTGSGDGTSHIKLGETGSAAVTPSGKRNNYQHENMPYWLQPSIPALSEVILIISTYVTYLSTYLSTNLLIDVTHIHVTLMTDVSHLTEWAGYHWLK